MNNEQMLFDRVRSDPGDRAFVELTELLSSQGQTERAISVALAGLTKSPDEHLGRMALAEALLIAGHLPFALRELQFLAQKLNVVPDSLRRLIVELGGVLEPRESEDQSSLEQEVAEVELDIDIIKDLEKK